MDQENILEPYVTKDLRSGSIIFLIVSRSPRTFFRYRPFPQIQIQFKIGNHYDRKISGLPAREAGKLPLGLEAHAPFSQYYFVSN